MVKYCEYVALNITNLCISTRSQAIIIISLEFGDEIRADGKELDLRL